MELGKHWLMSELEKSRNEVNEWPLWMKQCAGFESEDNGNTPESRFFENGNTVAADQKVEK